MSRQQAGTKNQPRVQITGARTLLKEPELGRCALTEKRVRVGEFVSHVITSSQTERPKPASMLPPTSLAALESTKGLGPSRCELVSKLEVSDRELDQVTSQLDRIWLSRKHGLPDDFLTITAKEIENVPFKGQLTRARLLSVVDGDTICVAIFCGQILKIKVRLDGIDTPEMHPKGKDTVGEALAAERVKNYVTGLLNAYQLVSVKLLKLDKYGGRYVGHVYLESGESISEHLLARGYAKKYDGRAKPPWKIEDFLAINSSK